mgnify:CR=1 FL=1
MNKLYYRNNVSCEICGEIRNGTVVNTTPPFRVCDECLIMMDRVIAMEVIGGNDSTRVERG